MKSSTLLTAALCVALAGTAALFVVDPFDWRDPAGGRAADACPHTLPAARCPFCTPERVEALGPCVEHGVPEALCTRCNAELIPAFEARNDWCAEHAVPESQCTLCRPALLAQGVVPPRLGDEPPNGASEHGASKPGGELPLRDVELVSADPDLPRLQRTPAVTCETSALRVRFRSPRIADDAGLEYAQVVRREVRETVTCHAELDFDGNRFARLASRAPGVVRSVAVDLGARVEPGALLAEIDSPELGSAKAGYLQARALVSLWERTHAREQALLEQGAGTERELLEAETELAESRILAARAAQRLHTLGLDEVAVAQVAASDDTGSLLRLTAPFAGEVVARDAVPGEVVDMSTPLFAVADTSRMWALLDVYDRDVARVRPGQPVVLDVHGLGGRRVGGTLTWVAAQLDRHTRTLSARAELPNPDGLLRAGMFADAVVSVGDDEPALVVPKAAVQWEGCCNVVFVREGPTLFEPRKVLLGQETEHHVVVREGVRAGDTVVTTGSFLLKTELLKGSIGAGCCEVDPGS